MHRQWRLGAHLSALAFEAFEQRGFFAANVSAGADAQFDIEMLTGSERIRPEAANGARSLYRFLERCVGVRIFGAGVDVALRRADREAADRHAFNQRERIALHDHAISERAAIAFIGVADDVFLIGFRVGSCLPLYTGGESGAAAAAQTGFGDFLERRGVANLDSALEALEAAMGDVILHRQRIDNAAARKHQPRLALQPGMIVDRAEAKRMGAAR
jgi:hypothetical protein